MREAGYRYNQHILTILGYSLIIGIPLLFILFNLNFYIMSLDLGGQENILLLFSSIFMFILLLYPFYVLYDKTEQDEEVSLRMLLGCFVHSFGPILFMSLLVMVAVYIGIALFMIPGIILFPFLFLFPFMYEPGLAVKQWIKKTIGFHNNHLITIWVQILFWGCFVYLLWAALLSLVSYFEMQPMTFAILRMVFSLMVYPFVIFGISEKMIELKREDSRL